MKGKLTYTELDAERARLAKSEGMLGIALNLVLHRRADATEQTSHEGDRWKLQLYGARRADGGIVIETFYHPGQRPHSAAHYLEDLARVPAARTEGGLKYARAIERLLVARNRIVNAPEHTASQVSVSTPLQDAPGERDDYLAGNKDEVSEPASPRSIRLSVIVDESGCEHLEKLPELPDVAQAMSAYDRLWKAAIERGYTLRGGTLEVGGREFRVSQNGRIWDGDRAVSVEEAEALGAYGPVKSSQDAAVRQAIEQQPAQESPAEKAGKQYSIQRENGAVLAEGLALDQVEQWWKSGDGSGQTNGHRYFGLRTEDGTIFVDDAREERPEQVEHEDDEDLGR